MTNVAPTQCALDTFQFAMRMVRTVKRDRGEKLAAGRITQVRHDSDVACAEALLRLAKMEIIDAGQLN